MNGAMPKPRSLADRAAKGVCGDRIPRTAMRDALASRGGGAGEAPTPFYDQLMSMIHTTALENRRAAQQHDVGDAVSHAAHPWWRIHPLITCVVGLIVLAATGAILLAPEAIQRQPPIVTADADKSPEARLPVVDKAAAPDELAGRHVPVAEPDGSERSGVEEKQTAQGGIGVESLVAAKPDERPVDADGKAIANPKSEQPPPADAPSPIENGSVKRAEDPPATRIARVVSDVNMRAGPSNGQSVLATISRGSSIEVIGCRQWCEVIFAGQRGWIYRGFIAGH
jgi:SH3 domain-containing protein